MNNLLKKYAFDVQKVNKQNLEIINQGENPFLSLRFWKY